MNETTTSGGRPSPERDPEGGTAAPGPLAEGGGDPSRPTPALSSEGLVAHPGRSASQEDSPAPDGLREAGGALWVAVVADFDLSPPELALLATTCRQADDVAALEAVLAEQGPVVDGSKGQPRLSPVFGELRQGRIALAKLLGELRLPADDEQTGMTPAARRAQHAANARWTRVRAERDAAGLEVVRDGA